MLKNNKRDYNAVKMSNHNKRLRLPPQYENSRIVPEKHVCYDLVVSHKRRKSNQI